MSVSLRGRRFHYRFQVRGRNYSGVCAGCEIFPEMNQKDVAAVRKKALTFEANKKSSIANETQELEATEREIRKNKTVRALVENYRYELTGGKPVQLAEAFALAEAKPSKRKARSSYVALRKTYWTDFVQFLADAYPEVTDLAGVRRTHCEAYVNYIAEHGRYVKTVTYDIPGKRNKTKRISYSRNYGISAKTVKEIVGVARWVFSRLDEDAGLFHNPWDRVVLPRIEPIDREVFSPRELRLIWDGIHANPFCYVLFVVAANSGMTEGDICTLRWDEIDWARCNVGTRCYFGYECRFGDGCCFECGHVAKQRYPLLIFGGFGTAHGTTYFFNCEDGIFVRCGCFSGFIDQFREQVKATRNGKIADEYLTIADLVERKWRKK